VEIVGSRLRFTFRGKSGVSHEVAITIAGSPASSSSARTCRDRNCSSISTPRAAPEHLLGRRQCVSPGDDRRDITAKDFRTWAGTMLAAKQLCAIGPARPGARAERNMLRAIDTVADRLATRALLPGSTTCTRGCCGHINRGSP